MTQGPPRYEAAAPGPAGRTLVALAARPAATCRLVCFPCAGGGPAMFRPLARQLPDHVEVLAVCPPGRETRLAEPPATDLVALAAQITRDLVDTVAGPYLILGHSMGAMLGYEVCRWLQPHGPLPVALTVSACIGPDLPRDTELAGQSEARLAERLASLGGIPPEVAREPDLMRMILPIARADLRMIAGYRPRPGPPLDVDLLVVSGAADHAVTPAQMAGWSPVALRSAVHARPGGHFYLLDPANRNWLADQIVAQAARATGSARSGSARSDSGCQAERGV